MKLLTQRQIMDMKISPHLCMEWIEESFKMKYDSILPNKVSISPFEGGYFFNSMPCFLKSPVNRFGIKVVNRYPGREPALSADYLLYDGRNGEPLALMDASWITTMRTGAVAALAIRLFKSADARIYSFIGLGNTARATLLCMLDEIKEPIHIRLMAYKGQENVFMDRFSEYSNVTFEVVNDHFALVDGADVIVSCITYAADIIAPDEAFKPGCLLVPVHTRGFQNCDLVFDKVFADDTEHVRGFKFFSRFRSCAELSQVLLGQAKGRESDRERILSYNVGIGLHDLFFASKVYDMAGLTEEIRLDKLTDKFWI